MGSIRAAFNFNRINEILERFQEEAENKILRSLQYTGEQFVNDARSNDTYRDRTGNLRSSIGYLILKDGKIIDQNFEGNREGKKLGLGFAKEIGATHPKGWVLVGVAGMKYAAYVEAKGFDVITGSAPGKESIKEIFNEI